MAKKILEGIDATYGSILEPQETCLEPMTIQQIISGYGGINNILKIKK